MRADVSSFPTRGLLESPWDCKWVNPKGNQSCIFTGRKPKTNLGSTLKSRDITLPTKVSLVKDMAFPLVMYGCESWTIKKAEHQRSDASECGVGEDSWESLWTARSNQSILKEINPEYSLEGLMLNLKLQYFGYLMWRAQWLLEKNPDAGKDWRQKKKRVAGDEMIREHHQLNGYEFKQTPGDSEGQRILMCYSPWGCKKLDTT